MLKLIVDTMGGDNGSTIIVDAILEFLKDHQDVEITAVGKADELKALENKCRIIDAPDIVPMEAGALEVMHMKNSSMMVALKTLKEENLDGIISCGSTGGFLSASTLTLKMIPGVKRAALVTAFPTKIKDKKVVLLDIGANNENSPEELVQFALMGRLYSQIIYGLKEPNIYLLNNGTEEEKGAPEVKEAHRLLKESNFPGFKGNMEARSILNGDADVIVSDGYTGNILLKACEGISKFYGEMFKEVFEKNLWTKLGYLHVKGGIKELKSSMDYKKVGGALLIGINGVVVKAHGNSDAYSFKNAIEVAYTLAKAQVVDKIKEGLNK